MYKVLILCFSSYAETVVTTSNNQNSIYFSRTHENDTLYSDLTVICPLSGKVNGRTSVKTETKLLCFFQRTVIPNKYKPVTSIIF